MNSKITTNHNHQQLNQKNKNKLSKQLEQKPDHRNRNHMEGYQWGVGGGRMVEKVQGIRSINGRYKIVWEPWLV